MKKERLTFYIENNVNANIPIGIFADPDPDSNANVETMYKWDLTGLSFDNSNVVSISLSYRPSAGSVFTNFTYSGTITSFQQLLDILNGAGIGIFYRLQSGGYTYLAVSTDNYVFGNLTLLPAIAYEFSFIVSTIISPSISFELDFTSPTDITIDWGDGTSSNFTNQNGANIYSHLITSLPSSQNIVVITLSVVTGLGSLKLDTLGTENVVELNDIIALTALVDLDISFNVITVLPPFCASIINFEISDNQLPSDQINTALITLDTNGLLAGNFNSSSQVPPAPPTGAGITAMNNLIGKGWTVTTD